MLQVGTRNAQNFALLEAVGGASRPVLLKRGLSNTIEEWLLAAEYVVAHGNPNVVLCERGIRTFEAATRNTLDLSAVPVVKSLSHLPVIVDPSHATGHRPAGSADGSRRLGRRRGRAHDRGPSRSGERAQRRRAVADTGGVRGADGIDPPPRRRT